MKPSTQFIKKMLTAAMILLMAAVSIMPEASAAKVVGNVHILLTEQGEIRPVNGTTYLLIQSKENKLWGVYNTSGERLMADVMQNPQYVAFTCFSDQKPEPPQEKKSKKNKKEDNYSGLFQATYSENGVAADTLNNKALAAIQGDFISEYEYGFIKAYNQYWAVGWVVSDATEESYDYSPDKKKFYNIERCDVFALSGSTRLVAKLNRDQFETAAAHGQYFSIADREGNVSVYDADFNLTNLKTNKATDGIYNIVDFTVADRVKNEMILDGYTACKEITLSDGTLLLQITRTYLDGSKQSGIITLDGEWLLPLTFDVIKAVTVNYAVLADAENRVGLYSFRKQRFIVPQLYEKFLTSNKQIDQYNYYGYAIGIIGDTRYYINMETGETERELIYGRKMVTLGGTVYYRESRIRFLFTAANGKQWRLKDYRVVSSRGDGRLIVARIIQNGSYGIFNMNGNIVMDFKNKYLPIITDDGKVVHQSNKNGYQLLEIDW